MRRLAVPSSYEFFNAMSGRHLNKILIWSFYSVFPYIFIHLQYCQHLSDPQCLLNIKYHMFNTSYPLLIEPVNLIKVCLRKKWDIFISGIGSAASEEYSRSIIISMSMNLFSLFHSVQYLSLPSRRTQEIQLVQNLNSVGNKE